MPLNLDSPFIMKVVLDSVKKTFEERIALATTTLCAPDDSGAQMNVKTPFDSGVVKRYCPMLDQDVMGYLEPLQASIFDSLPNSDNPDSMGTSREKQNIPLYHDIWATMTMGWAL